MALLPDLALASLYAVVVFLLVLGFLVVFVEAISMRRLLAGLVVTLVIAAGLLSNGEAGLSLLAPRGAGGVLADPAVRRPTTRQGPPGGGPGGCAGARCKKRGGAPRGEG